MPVEQSPSSILGRTAHGPISDPTQLEIWPLKSYVTVRYETEELQANCPVTMQPDIYRAEIGYTAKNTIESKGLKHYLWSFRDRGISCEDLAQTIADELGGVLKDTVTVTLRQQVRGGLVLVATAATSDLEAAR